MDKLIFSVDAESDGLYGDIWAIGAVVMNQRGSVLDFFMGKAAVDAVRDEWVRENVVAPCAKLGEFKSRPDLRTAFWHFWMKWREKCVCVGDFGAPVEALLFRKCVEDDPAERTWLGPYPMHELGTALLLGGVDPDVNRIEFAGYLPNEGMTQHNPFDDAVVAAKCWLRITGIIWGCE